jgi:tetratricopeptide (TPR) repeat protein
MSESTVPLSPYKGLIPYSEEDAPFFFGRDEKREIITANLQASRLTVLHGPSGVGKSSILRAGVAYHLQQLAKQCQNENGNPEFAVIVFSSWRDDPVVGLATRIRDSIAHLRNGESLPSLSPSGGLAESLKTWTKRGPHENGPNLDLFIILDQFEEYFLYHPKEGGQGTLALELPRAINSPDLRVNFLISIREDALAKLERFKSALPQLFENRLSLEHLNQEAAREAIIKPIDQFNRLGLAGKEPFSVEPALVKAILEQIRTGKVVLGQAGRGVVESEDDASPETTQIETPYLQLVMTRLWEDEVSAGSRVLRLETLTRLGGSASIVRTHLDKIMETLTPEEQHTASRIFYQLVTPSGTKIAHTVPDLAAFAKLAQNPPAPMLVELLAKLSDNPGRILRPVDPPPNQRSVQRYEIFHDVLAPAVLDWQTRYTHAINQAKAEKRAEHKAAEQERHAAQILRLQQAEALAEAQRLRAEEQEERAKAERLRASEQQQRAEVEIRSAKRLRQSIVAMALMFLLTAIAAVAAIRQSRIATTQTRLAEEQRKLAEVQVKEKDKALTELKTANDEATTQTRLAERHAREAEIDRNKAKEAEKRATLARKEMQSEKEKLAAQNAELIRLRGRDRDQAIRERAQDILKGELANAESWNNYGLGLLQGGAYKDALVAHGEALRQYRFLKQPGGDADRLAKARRQYESVKKPGEDADRLDEQRGEARSLSHIARVYTQQATAPGAKEREPMFAKAEEYYGEALRIRKTISAKSDESADINELARVMNSFGLAYDLEERADKDRKARELYDRALQLRKGIFEEKVEAGKVERTFYYELAANYRNLAGLYVEEGKYDEAMNLALKAREIAEQAPDSKKENPALADSLNLIGVINYFQGKYDQAEPLYKESFLINQTARGPDYPQVASNMHNLGLLYFHQAKYTQAEDYENAALRISRKQTVVNHDTVALSLTTLARTYREVGKITDAEKKFQEAVEEMILAEGEKGRRVAIVKHYQAEFYAAQGNGNLSLAEKIEEEAIATLKEGYGADHCYVSRSLSTLAAIRAAQGNQAEAEAIFKPALDNLKIKLGADHPEVAASLTGLAKLYIAETRYQEAEPLLKEALAIRERIEPNHPYVADILENYSTLLERTGREKEAKERSARAQAIRDKIRAAYER